jgi:hypothetical protein
VYHYYLGFDVSLGLVPNYVMLVLDNLVFILGNEGGVHIISKVVIHGAYILVSGS